jgi:hypothetical protein
VGFKARERKRRRRAAGMAAGAKGREQRRSRSSGSSAGKWWLTIATRKGCCANVGCGVILKEGAEVVYRHSPMETLCVRCADRAGHRYRPSLRWERARRVPKAAA